LSSIPALVGASLHFFRFPACCFLFCLRADYNHALYFLCKFQLGPSLTDYTGTILRVWSLFPFIARMLTMCVIFLPFLHLNSFIFPSNNFIISHIYSPFSSLNSDVQSSYQHDYRARNRIDSHKFYEQFQSANQSPTIGRDGHNFVKLVGEGPNWNLAGDTEHIVACPLIFG
jgi:hypothetical protein